MRVTFFKLVERRLTTWEAVRGKRTRVAGPTMALGSGDLPHDLLQLIVEASVGIDHGFWGCVADGATFRSLRQKRTNAGRQVIAAHRRELTEAEGVVAAHLQRWRSGRPTPAAEPLERIGRLWAVLGDGEPLTIAWRRSKWSRPPRLSAVILDQQWSETTAETQVSRPPPTRRDAPYASRTDP